MEMKPTHLERKLEILEQLNAWSVRCSDQELPLRHIYKRKFDEGFDLISDWNKPDPFPLTQHAKGQLLTRLGIPAQYLYRCPEYLQADNVNHWTNRYGDKQVLARWLDREKETAKVRAIFSTRHSGTAMDDVVVVPLVLEELEKQVKDGDLEDLFLKDFAKAEDFTRFQVYYRHLVVKANNLQYAAGMVMFNSEVGKSSVWIKPSIVDNAWHSYTDRESEGCTAIRHVGELKADKIREAVVNAVEVAQFGIARLLQAQTEIITSPAKHVENFVYQSAAIPHRLAQILHDEWIEKQEATKLEIANSILSAVKDLPVFQKCLAEEEVGHFLDLFKDVKNRMKNILANE